MGTTEAAPATHAGPPGLRREVGFIGLIWASEGSIIGSGWLFGAQGALAAAGPAAIISWGIGGVAILILALVHAELGGMYPVSGGTARFPHYAFGGAAGASFGWFSWLQAATVAPIEVLAMITYGQHYSWANGWLKTQGGQHILTASGIAVAVGLMAVITAINFLSIRLLARTNSAATWWKVGIPLLTIFVFAVAQFHVGNFTAADGFNPYGAKGILSAVSSSGIIFALLGFEQADQLAGESANPKRDIPRAVIGSIVIGAIIYILLQVAFLAALPASQIQGTWATAAFNTLTGPFAQVATLISLGWLATVLYLDAVVSPAGTGLIYITGSSRVSYGLSRNGYVPSAFEATNRSGVPWVGLIAAFVVGCVCFLPFPSWRSLVGLITSASVLMYAGAPLSFGVFRRRLPNVDRPYRLPGGGWMSPLAFVVANFLILWSGWTTDWKLGIAILIGYVVLIANRVFRMNPVTPQLDLRAAQWLPAYLVGMGLVVYASDFGPLRHPWFPLWWDLAAVTVLSLAIYYWAMAVALPTERIQRMVDQVVVPEQAALH
ncbi:APC family permease [Streptomyces sp. RLB3-17]|uniref:APC family permease n=1 Tax=unclassified Streptomyces TaxID=2593676 RepID=UPI001161F7D5|nr:MULTISPECIES: APC family permease [unclassified Streptomyces]QDO02669.1 APC family permease [Streptomyces sp. RLB1-9]QDO24404.1 APC family permease [Streptomyces sp. S1A1-8]QDO34526.1 APC family permease [Streptomyces sp. S1A1-3]QDO44538.1 APC family permease [Streptomyces sp. RLB3-17]